MFQTFCMYDLAFYEVYYGISTHALNRYLEEAAVPQPNIYAYARKYGDASQTRM